MPVLAVSIITDRGSMDGPWIVSQFCIISYWTCGNVAFGRGSIDSPRIVPDSPRIVIFTLEYGQFCAIYGIAVAVLDMYGGEGPYPGSKS